MLHQNGIVTEVRRNSARIEFFRSGLCGGCAGDQGCGLGPILAMFNRSRAHSLAFDLEATLADIRAGDVVRIAIPGQQFLKVAGLAYFAPLVGMLTGAWLATAMLPEAGDVSAVVGAMTGIILVSRLLAGSKMAKTEQYLSSARVEAVTTGTVR